METKTKKSSKVMSKSAELGNLFGRMYSFNNSLKLYHWHVSGKGSYAEHMALDQALESVADVLDRIVETSYSAYGEVQITIPETTTPVNIVNHVEEFYKYIENDKELFSESFSQSILDDYHEAIQQLLYRLKRLQ